MVALIGSAGASILMLGLFQAELGDIVWGNIRIVELVIFAAALWILRKFKTNAITIIFGSGVVGTAAYFLMGAI